MSRYPKSGNAIKGSKRVFRGGSRSASRMYKVALRAVNSVEDRSGSITQSRYYGIKGLPGVKTRIAVNWTPIGDLYTYVTQAVGNESGAAGDPLDQKDEVTITSNGALKTSACDEVWTITNTSNCVCFLEYYKLKIKDSWKTANAENDTTPYTLYQQMMGEAIGQFGDNSAAIFETQDPVFKFTARISNNPSTATAQQQDSCFGYTPMSFPNVRKCFNLIKSQKFVIQPLKTVMMRMKNPGFDWIDSATDVTQNIVRTNRQHNKDRLNMFFAYGPPLSIDTTTSDNSLAGLLATGDGIKVSTAPPSLAIHRLMRFSYKYKKENKVYRHGMTSFDNYLSATSTAPALVTQTALLPDVAIHGDPE